MYDEKSAASITPFCNDVYTSEPGIPTGLAPALLKTSDANPSGARSLTPFKSSSFFIGIVEVNDSLA